MARLQAAFAAWHTTERSEEMTMHSHHAQIPVTEIEVRGQHRDLDPQAIDSLAASMARLGLRQSITVRRVDAVGGEDAATLLVAGQHRLAAARQLGWEHIDCKVLETDDDVEWQLWQIAENLHRAELTVLERAEQIQRWVELSEQRRPGKAKAAVPPEGVFTQLERKPPTGGRPKSGALAASRELGLNRNVVQRATQLGKLDADTKQALRDNQFDNNQPAMLQVANAPDPLAKVVSLVTESEKRKAARQAKPAPAGDSHPERVPTPAPAARRAPTPLAPEEQRLLAHAKAAWAALPEHVQYRFLVSV